MPNLQDESLPLDAGSFVQDDSIMSTTTTEHSEVNISALEKELGNEVSFKWQLGYFTNHSDILIIASHQYVNGSFTH